MKLSLLSMLLSLMLFVSNIPTRQNAESNLLGKVIGKTWEYQKCTILGIPYPAEQHEVNDRLKLSSNHEYMLVEDGKKSTGSWTFDSKNKKITLIDITSGNTRELFLKEVSKEEMVYQLKESWKFNVTVFMRSDTQLTHPTISIQQAPHST
ncbi:hypothetical protein V6R21_21065 [Limibacter armeniacum]|uniref:hypothetical protein n=1 Tax=Limibacter armeniacum TaxID=466084 RepID=UPI002FE6441B